MPRGILSRASGLTTMELVVAVAILVVASAGLASLSTMTISGTTENRDRAAALALAIQKMEELENTRLPALTAGSYADAGNPIDEKGAVGGVYTRTWDVSASTLSGIPVKDLLVEVSWAGGGTVELRARIAEIPTVDAQYGAFSGAFPQAAVRSWEEP